MDVELLWFSDCPNHEAAEAMLRDVLTQRGLDVPIRRTQVEDEATGIAVRFPGSPTIRIDGVDVEPGFIPSGEYAPRCRVYVTTAGLSGIPAREWIEAAIDTARSR